MLLAAEAQKASSFHGFDVFMILFTILILAGVVRIFKSPDRSKFSMGFSVVALLVFLVADAVMVATWLGIM